LGSRKAFLAAAASAGAALMVVKNAEAETPPPAAPAAPPATPHASPSPKPPSAAARAMAEQMRAFDKNLSDKEIETIASGIDDNLGLGKTLNPGGKTLKNWDEPMPFFRVSE
jgi:hypothetical protein